MELCNQCPRNCKIDRKSKIGFCGASTLKIAKVMKHYWEEPIISGKNGSGTIFFSHCSLKCCYCQNFEISHKGIGKDISINDLANIFKLLEDSGVNNINLVSPTHYTNEIIQALKIYKPKIPIVWNTSGYETVENIEKLKDYVDIYLCDFKYFNNELAQKYSTASNYFENCTQSLLQMRKNQPKDVIKNKLMQKGLVVRHLILPTHSKDSIEILKWINENLTNKTFVSLMSQFMPCFNCQNFPEINRKLSPLEYKFVLNFANKLNFKNGFVQELSSSNSDFVPNFSNNNIFEI